MYHHDPHRPPHSLYYSDIEPAYERPAECDCHTQRHDECICVRQDDVDYWNSAANAVSSLIEEGIDMDAISDAAKLAASANYWNTTYETVSANSAYWNEVSAASADLYVASSLLASDIKELSAKKYYVDDDTITGDGSMARPWGVSYKDQIDSLIDQYESLTGATPAIADLARQMMDCKEDLLTQIAELSGGHIQNFELILQLMGVRSNSANRPEFWIEDSHMKSDSVNSYKDNTALNYMYYSTYER